MNIVGSRVKLSFGEPWNDSRVIIGMVIMVYSSVVWGNYLLIEDISTQEKYVVNGRYLGDDVMQISTKKDINVNIFIPKTSDFTFNDPNYHSLLTHYGIGPLIYIG